MGGSFIMKMLCPLHLFFSWELSGAAQRQAGGSFIYISLTSMGKLGGSWGLSGILRGSWEFLGLGGSPGAYRGQFY